MPEYAGDYAVQLPNLFPNPGLALQSYINNQQRNTDSILDWQYRMNRERDGDAWRRIGLIKTEVNPEDVATGNVDANVWFDNEAKRVQNEILSDPNMKGMPPEELYRMIQQKWLPVVQGAQIMKTGFSQIDQNTKQIGTEQKTIATDKLSQAAKMKFLDDWMPINPATGKREYKNQGHLPDKNYAADIVNSPDRWRYIQGGALEKYLTGFKADEINPYKQLSKDQSIVPYKGRLAPWSELNVKTDENNKLNERDNPQVQLKTEDDFITEGGERIPIKVLNKDVYKAYVTDIPENNDDATRMWEEFKEKNNIKSKNAVEDEKRKRAFLVGVFKQHDPSEIHGLVAQHLPRNTTNINVGGSKSKNVGVDWVKDAAAAVKSGDQSQVENVFSLLFGGNTRSKFKGVKIEDGKLFVNFDHIYQDPQPGLDYPSRAKVWYYDVNDPHLQEKLTEAYQEFTGSDAKVEDVPRYKERQSATPKPEQKKITKPKDPLGILD